MKKMLAMILACCMLLTAAAVAEGNTYNVGILQLVQHSALDAATQGFRDAVTAKCAENGDSVVFDEQNAQGDAAQCSTIATGFVANEYDLIMANATPALQACMTATTTIPVLGTSVTDYATALQLDTVAGGTGINVSGTSDGVPGQLYADCLMELVPAAKKVGVFYCSAEANSVVQADDFIASMAPYGVECVVATFADSNDMQAQLAGLVADGIDALYIPTDNTAASNMTIVANIAIPAQLPVICGEENMMGVGGLATVSISYYDIGYVCGEMAYAVLTGADIATMEIGYAANPVKEYNPDFAAAIGFQVPDTYAAYQAQ